MTAAAGRGQGLSSYPRPHAIAEAGCAAKSPRCHAENPSSVMARSTNHTVRAAALGAAYIRVADQLPEQSAQEVVLRLFFEALGEWRRSVDREEADYYEGSMEGYVDGLQARWRGLAEWAGADAVASAWACAVLMDAADRPAGSRIPWWRQAWELALSRGLLETAPAALELIYGRAAATRTALMAALGREIACETPDLDGFLLVEAAGENGR